MSCARFITCQPLISRCRRSETIGGRHCPGPCPSDCVVPPYDVEDKKRGGAITLTRKQKKLAQEIDAISKLFYLDVPTVHEIEGVLWRTTLLSIDKSSTRA